MVTTIRIGTFFGATPVISADGRYMVFVSALDELDNPNDNNGADDVVLQELATGELTYVSVSDDEVVGNRGSASSDSIAISADGRFVTFASDATNLVPNDTNGEADLFLRDVVEGTTTLISQDSNGNTIPANLLGDDFKPSISADGRFVAFETEALFAGSTTGKENIFVRDVESNTTELISVNSDGVQGNNNSRSASISADGRFVAFYSLANNLVDRDNLIDFDIFVRDRQNETTIMASINSQGEKGGGTSENETLSNSDALDPVMSPDGRYVVFRSSQTNLVPNDTNGFTDIFKHDLQTRETTRISVDSNGNQANGSSAMGFNHSAISADGRYIVFQSVANNLVEGDTNNALDVFVRDTVEETTTRVSLNANGEEPVDGYLGTKSFGGTISGDGQVVIFMSNGSNMNDEGINTPEIYWRNIIDSTDEQPTNVLTLTGGTAQIAYVAYYGRPADPGGVDFWDDLLTENEVSYAPRNGDRLTGQEQDIYNQIVNQFGTSDEADRLFGNIENNRDKIDRVYQLAFNRDGDPEGLDYWTEQLDSGSVTLATFAMEVALGAQNDDIVTLNHKIDSANLFSNSIDTQAEIDAYSGSSGEVFGRDWLDDYGATTSSQAEVDLALTNLVDGDF